MQVLPDGLGPIVLEILTNVIGKAVVLIYTCVNAIEASDGGRPRDRPPIPHKLLDIDKPLHLVRKVEVKVAHMRVRSSIPDDNRGAEAREIDDRVGEERHRCRVVRLQRLQGLD